jgi:hypothetical protein
MHPRLQEITADIARVRADLAGLLSSTPADRLSRDPGGGQWTGVQLIEHLGKVEGSTSKMLEGLFVRALMEGLPADPETSSLLHSLDHLRIVDRSRRIAAPERLVPSAEPDLAVSWESLQKVRLRTLAAVATVDGRDLTRVSAPHPIFGPIDGYQWVLFLGQHEERHLDQMREVLRTT